MSPENITDAQKRVVESLAYAIINTSNGAIQTAQNHLYHAQLRLAQLREEQMKVE